MKKAQKLEAKKGRNLKSFKSTPNLFCNLVKREPGNKAADAHESTFGRYKKIDS